MGRRRRDIGPDVQRGLGAGAVRRRGRVAGRVGLAAVRAGVVPAAAAAGEEKEGGTEGEGKGSHDPRNIRRIRSKPRLFCLR
jgi:hypothetical protein